MDISLDKTSLIPLGEQLQTHIRLLIQQNELAAPMSLPTVKELASSLNLNYNTVAAAYRALEREGYLVQNRRAGTRVAKNPPKDLKQELALALSATLNQRLEALELDTNMFLKLVAAQRGKQQKKSAYKLAVLARTPLEAMQAAEKTKTLLGEQVSCVPEIMQTYNSMAYHLTVIDPKLVPALSASANVIPQDTYAYSHDFPAGAD